MDTKYNYVLYNICEECYVPVLWPLERYPFVRVYKHAFRSGKLWQKLFFLHWSAKLNRKVDLPFKSIWFSRILKQDFECDKPCCYVFLGGKYLTQTPELYKYIKKLNPENRAVVLCGDLIAKKNWDMDSVKALSDMIVTYDGDEAKKYGVQYLPLDFYGAVGDVTTPEEFEYDVYFLGFAKDRLEEIHSAYKRFSQNGSRCKFIICGTEEKDRIEGEGLQYSLPIGYEENLRNVRKSRCLLEIIQGGSSSPTLRLREACTYKRKLITNNANPIYSQYISGSNLCVYEDINEVDDEFVSSKINYEEFKENSSVSPLKLIEYLENNL